MRSFFNNKEKLDEEFENLIKGSQNELYRIAKIKLDNDEDIADIIQSTILLAYKKENKELEYAECARNEAINMRDAIRTHG